MRDNFTIIELSFISSCSFILIVVVFSNAIMSIEFQMNCDWGEKKEEIKRRSHEWGKNNRILLFNGQDNRRSH